MTASKVLIIDQNKATSTAFRKILRKRGFDVDVISDTTKAVERILADSYDAVLINLDYPDLDGKDLLFFAKKNMPKAARIATIAGSSLEKTIKALESGADAVLAKPISPEELIKIIETLARK